MYDTIPEPHNGSRLLTIKELNDMYLARCRDMSNNSIPERLLHIAEAVQTITKEMASRNNVSGMTAVMSKCSYNLHTEKQHEHGRPD